MNPLSVAPGSHQPCPSQIGQMPANFWLVCLEYFHEKTDANFFVTKQVQQAQPRAISHGRKEPSHIKWFLLHAPIIHQHIYDLTDMTSSIIVRHIR